MRDLAGEEVGDNRYRCSMVIAVHVFDVYYFNKQRPFIRNHPS